MSRFDGHRVYNGCPDSTLQRRWDEEKRLLSELQQLEPEARVTYHPDGEKFQAHVWGKPLSGMCESYVGAILEAIQALSPPEENPHA